MCYTSPVSNKDKKPIARAASAPRLPIARAASAPRLPIASAASDPQDIYDCRTCGACCAPEINDALYVGVTASDIERMTPRWRSQHVAHDAILTKLDPRGRCVCVALRGAIGGTVSCAIYERRPDECRRLLAGSRECRRARRQAGM